jgi:hypothetical protein
MKFKSFKIFLICLTIKIKFLARKFFYKNFTLQPLFQSLNTFMRKGEGSGAEAAFGSVRLTDGSGTLHLKQILVDPSFSSPSPSNTSLSSPSLSFFD